MHTHHVSSFGCRSAMMQLKKSDKALGTCSVPSAAGCPEARQESRRAEIVLPSCSRGAIRPCSAARLDAALRRASSTSYTLYPKLHAAAIRHNAYA